MAAKGSVEEIDSVQVDGLVSLVRLRQIVTDISFDYDNPQVALKIIKHCQEDGSSSELVTGFLVGLVVGRTLEITNCFALPKDFESQNEESE